MEEILDKLDKTSEIKRDENGRILPGQSSLNPLGRGAGQTLKEFQAKEFKDMNEDQKRVYLADIAKDVKWKMAEGNPKNDLELSGEVKSKIVKLDE